MSKLDKLYDSMNYLILTGFIVAYFVFQALEFEKPILDLLQDYRSIVHLIFVVVANVIAASIASDHGLDYSLTNVDFINADKLNNEMIKDFNNNFDKLLDYVEYLNDKELLIVQRDFYISVGKRLGDKLTNKEQKQFVKLIPNTYSVKGINLPLFYETSRGGIVSHITTFDVKGNKFWNTIKKALFGLIFGSMTLQVVFKTKNLGQAFYSTLILTSGIVVTYFIQFIKPVRILTKELPKKVDNKKTFYDGYKEWTPTKLSLIVPEDTLREHIEKEKDY